MKNYALVTGASKGIGRHISLELAAQGFSILLVSRDEKSLAELTQYLRSGFNVDADFLALDLAEPAAPEKVLAWCMAKGYRLQVLVNNAGYGLWGDFAALGLEEQLNMINLNICALVSLTHLLMPQLWQNEQAYILNVGSTAAYQAVPTLAVYAATKAFVLSFSRAIRIELKNTPVSVTCLCPGATNTGFVERAGMDALKEVAEKFGMTPEAVAKKGVKAMLSKKAEVVPGLMNNIMAKAVSFVPKALTERIAAGLYKVPGQKK